MKEGCVGGCIASRWYIVISFHSSTLAKDTTVACVTSEVVYIAREIINAISYKIVYVIRNITRDVVPKRRVSHGEG